MTLWDDATGTAGAYPARHFSIHWTRFLTSFADGPGASKSSEFASRTDLCFFAGRATSSTAHIHDVARSLYHDNNCSTQVLP